MRGAQDSEPNNDAYRRHIHSLVMPSFEVEFEVFCGTCGAGLCNQSDTRKSRRRGENQVTVEVCQTCIEKAETPLRERIEELEQLLEEAREIIPA
jgi:hypothetical protein